MSPDYQDDLTLDALRDELSEAQPKNPYTGFFLLSNPFPVAGGFSGICVDQDEVKKEFARTLREFYLDGQSRRMTLVGRTGAGKTNLLKFFQQRFREWREPLPNRAAITDLFTVFVREPQGGYFEAHRQIVSQLGALFYTDFFEAVHSQKINLNALAAELSGLSPELIRVLDYLARQLAFFKPSSQSFRVLDNWLQGVRLSTAERRQLGGVSVDISKSTTIAIKFLGDLITIFKHAELFRGLVVLFDEFEGILSGLSPTNQARYAQDLRNLFDTLRDGVVFVIATAPISTNLSQVSPALSRRLGHTVDIQPIQDEESAFEYARAYIRLGRDLFQKQMGTQIDLPQDCLEEDVPFYPLTQAIIAEVFGTLRETQGSIVPGDFLPELNLRLYRRVYEMS